MSLASRIPACRLIPISDLAMAIFSGGLLGSLDALVPHSYLNSTNPCNAAALGASCYLYSGFFGRHQTPTIRHPTQVVEP